MENSEQQCIWMTSGIISYKLCTLDYLCEECMFHRVMQNDSAAMVRRPKVDAALAADLASIDSTAPLINGSCFYHKHHCWVKVKTPGEIEIGINAILARLLYGVKTLVLPGEGESLVQNEHFAHIIQENHIVPLLSPVSGTILTVNSELLASPELVSNDFHCKGWLVTVQPKNLESDLRTLVFGKRAEDWHQKMDKEVSEAMHAMYSVTHADLGPTMQDGGELILKPAETFSALQYDTILEIISKPE